MNSEANSPSPDLPDNSLENDAIYSLEIIAELAGVSPQTVLHYRELALISPVAQEAAEDLLFDTDCLRQLRRIEHLRSTHEVNDAALQLILSLLNEVERLREELRQMTR